VASRISNDDCDECRAITREVAESWHDVAHAMDMRPDANHTLDSIDEAMEKAQKRRDRAMARKAEHEHTGHKVP
jgi:hypothetical protein